MQLLCMNEMGDFATWKEVFDADREAHGDAGLTLLQLWREADSATRVWFLFEVSDRGKAEAYLSGARADLHAKRAGVGSSACHFLETA